MEKYKTISIFAILLGCLFALQLAACSQIVFAEEVSVAIKASAQLPEIPDVDTFQQAMTILKNWRTMSPVALGVAVVIFFTALLKKNIPGFKYKRLTVTVLAVAYGILVGAQAGLGWAETAVAALLTGGGAVAIYEAWKGTKAVVGKVKP